MVNRRRAHPRSAAATLLGLFHRPDHPGIECRLCRQRANYIIVAIVGARLHTGRVCYAHGLIAARTIEEMR